MGAKEYGEVSERRVRPADDQREQPDRGDVDINRHRAYEKK